MTGYLLLVYRVEHTLHGCLDILDRLVDDTVQTHIDFLAVRDGSSVASGRTTLKPIMIALEADAKGNIGLVDRADAAMDDFDNNFLVGKLFTRLCFTASTEPCTSAFYDDWKFLDISGLDLGEQVV